MSAFAEALPRRALFGAAIEDRGGVRVTTLRPGGAAERSSIHVGDVIAAVGADKMETVPQFIARVKAGPSGTPIPFHIVRGSDAMTINVTLDAPPNEDASYESIVVDGTRRRTIVTTPKNVATPKPAVLIIGGIGCYSVDTASDPEDAYKRLAHDVSAAGFLVVRLEKSGVGDSEGPPCFNVDFESESRSYAVALEAMTQDPRIDPHRIFLFGHSIGTLIAPSLAQTFSIHGVIAADGVGRNWIEYELSNLRRQLVLDGTAPADVDTAMAAKEICMHRLLVDKQPEAKIEESMPGCKDHNAYPINATYMQQVAAINIAGLWSKFAAPLLAIYGSGDFITSEDDHQRIVAIVNAQHPGFATLRIIPGMDHHLDLAGTQQQAWDLRVKKHSSGPYDTQLSAAVVEWLLRVRDGKSPSPAAPGR